MAMSMKSIVFGTAFLIAGLSPALADDSYQIDYDVNVGGARIMKADLKVTIDSDDYNASLNARSVGMSKLVKKIKLNLDAKGEAEKPDLVPVSFNYERKKNDKTKRRKLTFNQGKLVSQGTDFEPKVLAAIGDNTIDPLTMLLKLGRSSNPCSGKHRAFDGRDVFDVTFANAKKTGRQLDCTLIYTPIAGGDVEDGETDKVNYKISFVEGGTAGYLPVRVSGSSTGISFDVTATEVSLNGSALTF
jgi:hypothetical protein